MTQLSVRDMVISSYSMLQDFKCCIVKAKRNKQISEMTDDECECECTNQW